ncbi:MAG: aldehyde dehydrogenase family protein [Firmicutes bacterium]|jgi:acyl-CoA reductase-like NAD-dependent aldehyde dehydrogenase|nr:aldehyde dehydrogenase family protein [Bacillota bacterium]
MKAKEAVDWLDSKKWSQTSIEKRIEMIKKVQKNLNEHIEDLAAEDTKMKKLDTRNGYLTGLGYQTTVVPVGGQLNAVLDIYESILGGEIMHALEVNRINDDTYDLLVFPQTGKDKMMYSDRKDYLRVKGNPKQISPLDRAGGITAVLGAGNYSSAVEMVNALFIDNCAVVHKPHHMNSNTDKIWEQIFKPLIEYKALSFCDSEGGRELVKDDRVDKIYFTGGTKTAEKIKSDTKAKLVSECGGNNPCIVIPGDRPWTEKELKHQAQVLVTVGKLNGGAVCGRPQTFITSKKWSQRRAFLDALKEAIVNDTPAATSYYPGTEEVMENFKNNHPEAEILKPEKGNVKNSEFIFIEDIRVDSYAVTNEAFCQIFDEIAIDNVNTTEEFINEAVKFSNSKLHGSLGSMIVVDDDTLENHRKAVADAVTELRYGSVGVNTPPPFIFMNPYLTWGGHEEAEKEHFVSGIGNFGNVLGYENVEKSISYNKFVSSGDMISDNKGVWLKLSKAAAQNASNPTWMNLFKMVGTVVFGNFRKKDF